MTCFCVFPVNKSKYTYQTPKKKLLQPPRPRSSRRQSRHHNEATNFAFSEDIYDEVEDTGASPSTDYFYDNVTDGPGPSPIMYNDFEKGGLRIVVSPSCIDFHNLDDDEKVLCTDTADVTLRTTACNISPRTAAGNISPRTTSAKASPMAQRSISVDSGLVDRVVHQQEPTVEVDKRHASIC